MKQILVLLLSLFWTHNVVLGQTVTLREIINADPDFSTLGQALDTAGLDIGGFFAPITLFAPTNAAFSALDAVLLGRLLSPGWGVHLIYLLNLHLLDQALTAESLVAGSYVAVNGETLTVAITGTSKEISSPNTVGALITLPEIVAPDGVFYEIDAVLLPSYASIRLVDIAASLDFSILYELLVLTGLDQVLNSGITATVFAPNDAAFNALGSAALAYYRSNVDVTTRLLSGHVAVDQVVPSVDIIGGPISLMSVAGESLLFSLEETPAGDFIYVVNGVEVTTPDVLANNGIVHVLNGVIPVPGTEVPSTPSSPVANPPVAGPVAAPKVGGMRMMDKAMDMAKGMMMVKDNQGGMGKENKGKGMSS